jgi:hypothetical protein
MRFGKMFSNDFHTIEDIAFACALELPDFSRRLPPIPHAFEIARMVLTCHWWPLGSKRMQRSGCTDVSKGICTHAHGKVELKVRMWRKVLHIVTLGSMQSIDST